jgi:transcriptional regulator with XRE-family HTH domain
MNFNNDNLRKLRLNSNLTQENMADIMDIEHSAYNRLENGKLKLKMEHIPKIAKAFSKKEDDILKELMGWAVNTSNHDNAQNNQNLVINVQDKDFITSLIIEKDNLIKEKAKVIELLEEKLSGMNKDL